MNNFEDKKQKAELCRMVRKITAFEPQYTVDVIDAEEVRE